MRAFKGYHGFRREWQGLAAYGLRNTHIPGSIGMLRTRSRASAVPACPLMFELVNAT